MCKLVGCMYFSEGFFLLPNPDQCYVNLWDVSVCCEDSLLLILVLLNIGYIITTIRFSAYTPRGRSPSGVYTKPSLFPRLPPCFQAR